MMLMERQGSRGASLFSNRLTIVTCLSVYEEEIEKHTQQLGKKWEQKKWEQKKYENDRNEVTITLIKKA